MIVINIVMGFQQSLDWKRHLYQSHPVTGES